MTLPSPFRPRRRPAAFLAILALALAADAASAQEKIPVPGSDRYRVRYADGTVSVNDLCPVLQRGIGTRKLPVWVNGQPVGFC